MKKNQFEKNIMGWKQPKVDSILCISTENNLVGKIKQCTYITNYNRSLWGNCIEWFKNRNGKLAFFVEVVPWISQ